MVQPTDQQVTTPVVSHDAAIQPEVATPEPVVVSPVVQPTDQQVATPVVSSDVSTQP